MARDSAPIVTTTTNDPAVIIGKIDAGCDVELGAGRHRAAVVGIADLGGGKFSIDIKNDTNQKEKEKNDADLKTETVTLDTGT